MIFQPFNFQKRKEDLVFSYNTQLCGSQGKCEVKKPVKMLLNIGHLSLYGNWPTTDETPPQFYLNLDKSQ
jgi:hypothetical protein